MLFLCSVPESFHGNPQFHGCISVDGDELVVLEKQLMTLAARARSADTAASSPGLTRQKYGYGKDSIPLD